MAKRKIMASTALVSTCGPSVINAARIYDPADVHSWLPLTGDPTGAPGRRIMHGTLRLRYRDHANSAEAFVAAKLRVADSPDPLAITAVRAEVIVPVGVDDAYADPWLLPRLIDHAMARETDRTKPILCYATVTEPDVVHLHEQWRRGRAIVERLVDRFEVPVLLVQHAPRLKANGNAPHLHLLAGCRTLDAGGFGTPVAALIGDRARKVFVDAWNDAD